MAPRDLSDLARVVAEQDWFRRLAADAQAAAVAALGFSPHRRKRPGRKSLHEKADPSSIAIAKKAWAIRQKQPTLGWDKIRGLVGGPSARTLQRWVEVERLHER